MGHQISYFPEIGVFSVESIYELKPISQNLMHSNISIPDGIYGVLSETDRKNIFSGLHQNRSNYYNKTIDEIIVALEKLIDTQ